MTTLAEEAMYYKGALYILKEVKEEHEKNLKETDKKIKALNERVEKIKKA